MKVIDKNGELIGYPSDSFCYEFEGYYKTSDDLNSLMFFGYILKSFNDDLIDKVTGNKITLPTVNPLMFSLPLKDKEIQYKDKNTGESKTFTQKTSKQYAVIKLILDNCIGENIPFKAILTTGINEGLCDVCLTGINPLNNEKIDNVGYYHDLIKTELNPQKITMGLENKLLSMTNGKKFQKTFVSETDKLTQRLTWLCENYITIIELSKDITALSKAEIPLESGIGVNHLISLLMK